MCIGTYARVRVQRSQREDTECSHLVFKSLHRAATQASQNGAERAKPTWRTPPKTRPHSNLASATSFLVDLITRCFRLLCLNFLARQCILTPQILRLPINKWICYTQTWSGVNTVNVLLVVALNISWKCLTRVFRVCGMSLRLSFAISQCCCCNRCAPRCRDTQHGAADL